MHVDGGFATSIYVDEASQLEAVLVGFREVEPPVNNIAQWDLDLLANKLSTLTRIGHAHRQNSILYSKPMV